MWGVVALVFLVRGGGRFSVDDKIGREFRGGPAGLAGSARVRSRQELPQRCSVYT